MMLGNAVQDSPQVLNAVTTIISKQTAITITHIFHVVYSMLLKLVARLAKSRIVVQGQAVRDKGWK